MTVSRNVVAAVVGTDTLNVLSGMVTLDEGWSPYAQSTLTISTPVAATLTALDPTTGPRVALTTTRSVLAGSAFAPQSTRTFNLAVTSRTVDHVADTVQLQLASDEALLQNWALVDTVSDTSALAHQGSVRDIINSCVLSKIGASLAGGVYGFGDGRYGVGAGVLGSLAADADFTTLTQVENLCWNGSFENGTAYWFAGGGSAGIASVTSWASSGTHAMSVGSFAHAEDCYANYTAPTNGSAGGDAGAIRAPFSAGNTYTIIGTGHVPTAMTGAAQPNRARTITAFVKAPSLGANYVEHYSAAIPNTTGATERVGVTFDVPSDATEVFFRLYCGHVDGTIFWDDIVIVEGDGLETDGSSWLPYFDGTTTDTALYNYVWDAVTSPVYAGASKRIPVFQRDPATLSWDPGVDAWSFIQPVLTQAGLRLFCDEQRVWRLVDNTYSVPGRVIVASGWNAYTASDTISLDATAGDGSPLWFDAVIVKYSWTDETGAQQVKYDIAKGDTVTKAWMVEYDRPYPGPGAANNILQRVQGQGRTFSLTAATDFNATPGMEASVTLPNTDDQLGYTSSIAWDLGADTMTVGTRGLIDLGVYAWGRIPAGISSADIPAGLHYPDAVDWSSL